MTILALDLSLRCTGYAILETNNEDSGEPQIKIVTSGIVETTPQETTGERLRKIQGLLECLLSTYKIDVVVREKGFTRHNIATQQIFKVVGVTEYTCSKYGFIVEEIAPTTIKKYIGGSGRASKEEVEAGLHKIVGERKYKSNDESDAVGVGITYYLKQLEGGR